jgi:glucosamine--fructose-6-phosphate aminotransferase (isomerizing)
VVHNGIIENFAPLRAELTAAGASFYSQTDTEVVAQLLAAYRQEGLAPRQAMQKALAA